MRTAFVSCDSTEIMGSLEFASRKEHIIDNHSQELELLQDSEVLPIMTAPDIADDVRQVRNRILYTVI